jgi:hypothetical protein
MENTGQGDNCVGDVLGAIAEYEQLLRQRLAHNAAVEREILQCPQTRPDVAPFEVMLGERRGDRLSMVSMIVQIRKRFVAGENWSAVHRRLRRLERDFDQKYERLEKLLYLLYVRAKSVRIGN